MRTTLNIDIDVLQAAKERARREGKSIGEYISQILRTSLTAPVVTNATRTALTAEQPKAVYGFRPFPKRGGIVTNEQIDKLREDDAY